MIRLKRLKICDRPLRYIARSTYNVIKWQTSRPFGNNYRWPSSLRLIVHEDREKYSVDKLGEE
jgi:hypothetical protein